MEGLIILPVFFALLWVLFILPQQRRVKAQQHFISTLAVGDEVVTAGGIHGTIAALDPDTVQLQVADGIELTFARGAIHGARDRADVPDNAHTVTEAEA